MERKWKILTDWKINLETEENRFEYFNKESFIPGQIYRIHRFTGLPVIVEFQKFGYRYNHKMTTTYPCILICNETSDVPIDEITAICVYSIDDENVSVSSISESMKTIDVSGFKDFVVSSDNSYHVNEKLRGIQTVSLLYSDKINISGELKITGIDIIVDRYPRSLRHGIRVELPTGDEITVSASDHPWIESNKYNYPVFIESESEIKWHKDLVAGEFYIMLNRFDEKKFILIRSISNDKIEYNSCTSRYDRNNGVYFVESLKHELMIAYATKCKFIPMNELM